MAPQQFTITIPDERVEDMRRRLRTTNWPGDFGNADWDYGVEEGWLREMVDYWANDYDWRAEEARMNSFPQFRVEIDGVPIHFMHVKSGRADAIPLILTHGWPWTFWDWRGVVENLSRSTDGPAFDIVVPSLPGYGFSSPLRTSGLDIRAIGRLWAKLMTEVLGYERFAAAGGDLGSAITAELGHAYRDRLLAVHFCILLLPEFHYKDVRPEDFAPDEQWMIARNKEAVPLITAHRVLHSTEPQTISYALADSPAGIGAWIWARRRAWSDCAGDVVAHHGRDFLCTLASVYWLTNTIASSLRLYKEQYGGGVRATGMPAATGWPLLRPDVPSIPVPTGVAVAPKEVALMPRAAVERRANLTHWQVLPRGGHFLPSEAPDLLADEYRTFFAKYG
jgi:pimeloyl-ACP methyl ester carboxylesterase